MSPRPNAAALPRPEDDAGQPRLLGVEVEFGGLTEGRAARILAEVTGGQLSETAGDYTVSGTPFGDCKIYMDTTLRDRGQSALGRAALDLARNVVPVELVTAPFDPARLGDLDAVLARFRAAGASGTDEGILLGFGLHLNVQIAAATADHLWSVLTAFALAEPLLRDAYSLDLSRRALPFVDPYPQRLLDVLAQGCPDRLEALVQSYLGVTHSRNHALDMLPIFAHLCPDLTRDALARGAGGTVSARPAYHYRMPDCRIDDPGWSLSGEWALWCAIERLAEDRPTLDRLSARWREMRADPVGRVRLQLNGWVEASEEILTPAGHGDLRRLAEGLRG
ncbi:amidoligase family protein [Pseudooceanicola sp. 200-1SW]|uniref:amidoligase family protein n=1 Tax=Pseudooceanicola sp. 200-1SW TaxID=3425949 RepID=UPI003D7FD98B